MRRWICLAMMAVALPASADIYKCDVGGKIVFQGTPCSAEEPGTITLRGVSGLGSAGGVSSGSARFNPPGEDASTMQKFRALMSTLEVVKLKADDCDWALKVRREIMDCKPFIDTQSSQYPDALNYMSEHGEEFANEIDAGRLNKMTRTVNEINDIQLFATEYLKTMSR